MAGVRIRTTSGHGADRFSREVAGALHRSILKGALLLGRKVAENIEAFKETVGTRRLSRSFLTPEPDGTDSFMLGRESPIYAGPHEFGATIHPVHGEYLTFQTPDGAWHSVKEVHIREKRYARNAIDEFAGSGEMESILVAELQEALP